MEQKQEIKQEIPVQAKAMEQNPWVVDVVQLVKHQDKNQESPVSKLRSIYRAPNLFTRFHVQSPMTPYFYIPQLVSFGPFHHGQMHVNPMEQHKLRALVHFLKAAKKPVQVFLGALGEVAQQLIDCYDQLDEKWSSQHLNEFLRMMLFDGCFMLEFLRTATGSGPSNGYPDDDPVFYSQSHGELYTLPFIKHDLLLLENQIPLLVLEKLIATETGTAVNYKQLNELVLRLWSRESLADDKCHAHVLDIFRDSMVRKIQFEPGKSSVPEVKWCTVEPIPLATELDRAGVKFKRSTTDSLQDITFQKGILSLPFFRVDDTTGSMLLNLMAYELSHDVTARDVTSYVIFMDNLLDSNRDAGLLQSAGIIEKYVVKNEELAHYFGMFSLFLRSDPRSKINQIRAMLNKYCRKRRNVWRANLVRTYCSNPWTVLSLLGAIFLLILTVLQTLYSILAYYHG